MSKLRYSFLEEKVEKKESISSPHTIQIDPWDTKTNWKRFIKDQVRAVLYFTKEQWRKGNNRKNQLLIYVHGYYNSEQDAIDRAKTLDETFGTKNVITTIFNWKSRNELSGYRLDQLTSEKVTRWFVIYLQEFGRQQHFHPFEKVNIIAHSMGNYILTESVKQYKPYMIKTLGLFKECNIISVAADVPIGDYNDAIVALRRRVKNWIHYWTASDKALWLSEQVLNRSEKQGTSKRAGQTPVRYANAKAEQDYAFVKSIEWKDVCLLCVNHGYIGDILGNADALKHIVLQKLRVARNPYPI